MTPPQKVQGDGVKILSIPQSQLSNSAEIKRVVMSAEVVYKPGRPREEENQNSSTNRKWRQTKCKAAGRGLHPNGEA